MTTVGEFTVIVVIQTIIILTSTSVIFFFLWFRAKNKLRNQASKITAMEQTSPVSSLQHYLSTEIKLTKGRFDLLFKDADRQHVDIIEPDWLLLRNKYLELELSFLGSQDRNDPFWTSLGKSLRQILNDCYMVKRLKLKTAEADANEEIHDLKSIINSQNEELESLLAGLENEESKIELKNVKQKLDVLSRSHKELSHCIAILEDENFFLRNQISGLLKL